MQYYYNNKLFYCIHCVSCRKVPRRDFHANPGNMYSTKLIVAGLSLVQFCGNWKSPWSTRSAVVKTAWDQVKIHAKLWVVICSNGVFRLNGTGAFCATNSLHFLKSCQGSCHVYIETNFNTYTPMICQNSIIQWLSYSNIHACTASTKAKSPLASIADMASSGLVLGHSLAHSALRYSGAASDEQLDTSAVKKRKVRHNLLSCTLYQNNWLLCSPLFLIDFYLRCSSASLPGTGRWLRNISLLHHLEPGISSL